MLVALLDLIRRCADLKVDVLRVVRVFVDLIAELGYKPGQVFGLIRGAISGQKVTPPLFDCMVVIGKEKVLERLQNAIGFLKAELNA